MTLYINGKPWDFEAAPTLPAILELAKIPPQSALIEMNGIALRRDEWPSGTLEDGSRLEILRIVAGG
jgi:thiamine biosynthesis protein ThiS